MHNNRVAPDAFLNTYNSPTSACVAAQVTYIYTLLSLVADI
jgi:hypothetical protein